MKSIGHLPVQSQQQKKTWNQFKVNNSAPDWRLYFTRCSNVSIVDFEQPKCPVGAVTKMNKLADWQCNSGVDLKLL